MPTFKEENKNMRGISVSNIDQIHRIFNIFIKVLRKRKKNTGLTNGENLDYSATIHAHTE